MYLSIKTDLPHTDQNPYIEILHQPLGFNIKFTKHLTLSMLRLLLSKAQKLKVFENHLNPIILVFIKKLSSSTLRWVPICQGF